MNGACIYLWKSRVKYKLKIRYINVIDLITYHKYKIILLII